MTKPILETEIFPAFEEFLQPARFKVAWGGRGSAKCLGKGTKVIRSDASMVNVEDVKVGDKLLGPDGSERTVLSTARGCSQMYLVKQKTGIDYVVNDEHILALERSKSSANDFGSFSASGNPQRPNGRYAEYDTGKGYSLITAKEYAEKSERFKCQHYGFRRAIIGREKELPIDPYLLGLWLGDGSSKCAEFTTIDREIVDYLSCVCEQHGWTISVRDLHRAPVYHIGNNYKRSGSLKTLLRSQDLLGNKHIPECYFGASEDQRLKLLAGLVDTDGHVSRKGCIEISQSRENLLDDIVRLCHGLGFKASKKHNIITVNGVKCEAWKTIIGGDIDKLDLKIERKSQALSGLKKNKDWRRTRVDIEPIGYGEYFGFELDGDHLFMLEDGTVTHNTRQFTSILTNNVMCYGWRVVCFREIMKSIQDSVYQEFVDEINRRNLNQYFEILQTEIRSVSGGVIRFDGLFRNQQRVKGYAGFDAAWVEEAAAVTAESWKFLIPTLRKSGSEFWISFNPESPLDDTYRRFVTERVYPDERDGQRYCISKKINYTDNPRFPPELRDDMEIMKEEDYDLYLHVYEGEPVANSDLAVIKPAWIAAAVDVHLDLGIEPSGSKRIGFDVADEGPDANAVVAAYGQVIMAAHEWKDNDPNSAAVTAWDHAIEFGADKIIYDSIGVGAGAKGELRQCVARRYEGESKIPPEIIGFNAAAAVVDPDGEYSEGKRNRDMFTNAKAQAWWALRDGLYQAWKARNGKDYDIDKVISISSEIGSKALTKLKAELAQPRREYLSGKIRIEPKDKMARRGVKSPNLADAAVMAFAPEDNGGSAMFFKRRR